MPNVYGARVKWVNKFDNRTVIGLALVACNGMTIPETVAEYSMSIEKGNELIKQGLAKRANVAVIADGVAEFVERTTENPSGDRYLPAILNDDKSERIPKTPVHRLINPTELKILVGVKPMSHTPETDERALKANKPLTELAASLFQKLFGNKHAAPSAAQPAAKQ